MWERIFPRESSSHVEINREEHNEAEEEYEEEEYCFFVSTIEKRIHCYYLYLNYLSGK